MSNSSIYIKKISIVDHPYIKTKNFSIGSDTNTKRNIIITGKNGCGKSSLLLSLKGHIQSHSSNRINHINHYFQTYQQTVEQLKKVQLGTPQYKQFEQQYETTLKQAIQCGSFLNVSYQNKEQFTLQNHVLGYFEAKRLTNLSKPQNISAPQVQSKPIGDHNAGTQFLHHLVNRRSQLSFALEDNEVEEINNIRNWFSQLDKLFSRLFGEKVSLKFLRTELDFVLETENKEIIDLKTLSDGYSAIVSMVTEIIIRMEAIFHGGLDVNGIVLIDEVETHLHVSLQKEVLPFLTTMFPNIQFIVTTHSPFVLQSIDDAIIYDVETNQEIDQETELWKYSYEALVEGYFEVEKFSTILKDKIARYKELLTKTDMERPEKKELRQLKKELENVPSYKNESIELELKQLGLK